MAQRTDLSLVADIGGTNTRVALARGREVLGDTVRRYANADFPDIVAVLARFVADEGDLGPAAACVAAAGPVRDGAVRMTNIAHWPVIDADALRRATGAGVVAVLNDLQAQGHALGHVDPARTRTIIPVPSGEPGGTKLVIGVGTGFNAAPVHDTGRGRLIPPSESGHVDLPVTDEPERRLADWLRRMPGGHGFASVEEVLSGRGVEQVHAWLSEEEGGTGRLTAAEIMADAARGGPRAARTAGVLARMLGRVAGNLALVHLPFGGVWLVGGVARALAPMLAEGGFVEAFRDKGRFAGLMEGFGVAVVEDDYAALTGSASHLVGLLGGDAAEA